MPPGWRRPVTPHRLGLWAARTLFAGGLAYAAAVALGMATHGLRRPIGDPLLAIMEIITLVLAPAIVALMVALHHSTQSTKRVWTALAVAFATLLVGATMLVHFIQLTALRQMDAAGLAWPSPIYAAELLAWDVFFGLSLVCAAQAFAPSLRRALVVCGALCIAGVAGPALDMRFQFIAVFSYGLVFPIICFFLARHFEHGERMAAAH